MTFAVDDRHFDHAHAAKLETSHAVHRGVLQHQILVRVDALERALHHQRGFMEPAEDELELPRVGVDVPDGVDARHVGAVIEGVHLDGVLADVEVPVGNGAQLGAQTKQRHPVVRVKRHLALGLVLHGQGLELAVTLGADHFGVGQEANLALLGEVHDLLHAVEVTSESVAAVDQGDFAGDAVGQEDGPVEGAVPSSADHHALAAVELGVLDDVLHPFVLKVGEVGDGRLARLKTPQPTGDGNDGGAVHRAAVGGHDELVFVVFDNRLGALPQGEPRLERLRLLHQLVDQIAGQNAWVGGNVVDGLFGVNLCTLPTRLWQGVDEVATQLKQARFKDREQAAWACTDDQNVRLNHVESKSTHPTTQNVGCSLKEFSDSAFTEG